MLDYMWMVNCGKNNQKGFSFEIINAEVMQHMSIIKDFVFLNNNIHIMDGRKRNLNKKSSQTCLRWPHPLSNMTTA
jgi:hypothetical protein